MHLRADELMARAVETYRERNAAYGDSYTRFGYLMHILFPEGFTAETPDQWNQLGVLVLQVTKLVRFSNSGLTHEDSIHDLGVYSFMAQELLQRRKESLDK